MLIYWHVKCQFMRHSRETSYNDAQKYVIDKRLKI